MTREMNSVSLNLVKGSSVTAGSYCCQVPRSGDGMSTHCIMVTGEMMNTCFIDIIIASYYSYWYHLNK